MSELVDSEAEVGTDEELDNMSGSGDEGARPQISEDEDVDEEEMNMNEIPKDLGQ